MYYRRVIIPGATYFFTLNLLNRKSNLLIEQVGTLRHAFRSIRDQYPFKLDAIVILPEHCHMLMTLPPGDDNYSLRIRLIKSSFSQQVAVNEYIGPSRKNKGERGIWQRRFWEHAIRSEQDYEHHFNYIHFNPVKHNYVAKASA